MLPRTSFCLRRCPLKDCRGSLGGRSEDLYCQRNFSSAAPETSQLEPIQLRRVWGAHFFSRLLLHRLGMAPLDLGEHINPTEVQLKETFLDQMGEVMLCIGFLTSLADSSSCPASVNGLLASLATNVS